MMKLSRAIIVTAAALFSCQAFSQDGLIAQFVGISGEGCSLMKGSNQGASLYMDRYEAPYKHCTGCAGIQGRDNLAGAAILINSKHIPAAGSEAKTTLRLYALHSSQKAHQYELQPSITQNLLQELTLGQATVKDFSASYHDGSKFKNSNCKIQLKLIRAEGL